MKNSQKYRKLKQIIYNYSSDLHSTLREKGILFVEDDNLVYLIDKKNKVIVSPDDLGINIIKDGYSKAVSYTHLTNENIVIIMMNEFDYERLKEE